jgi:glutamate--cysteine ligase
VADGKRLTYEQIAALLTRIQERFGWKPIIEEGKIIGLTQDGQSVTLEPGGQFELSGAILDTLHKTCAEVNSHLYQVLVRAWDGVGLEAAPTHNCSQYCLPMTSVASR